MLVETIIPIPMMGITTVGQTASWEILETTQFLAEIKTIQLMARVAKIPLKVETIEI